MPNRPRILEESRKPSARQRCGTRRPTRWNQSSLPNIPLAGTNPASRVACRHQSGSRNSYSSFEGAPPFRAAPPLPSPFGAGSSFSVFDCLVEAIDLE